MFGTWQVSTRCSSPTVSNVRSHSLLFAHFSSILELQVFLFSVYFFAPERISGFSRLCSHKKSPVSVLNSFIITCHFICKWWPPNYHFHFKAYSKQNSLDTEKASYRQNHRWHWFHGIGHFATFCALLVFRLNSHCVPLPAVQSCISVEKGLQMLQLELLLLLPSTELFVTGARNTPSMRLHPLSISTLSKRRRNYSLSFPPDLATCFWTLLIKKCLC